MKKIWIMVTALCLAGCVALNVHPPEPATHWVRYDDWVEYHGVYLYSQTPDGRLWLTHYPENRNGVPKAPVQVGSWTQSGKLLTWSFMNQSNAATYVMSTNGVFVEQDGSYYVPVELKRVTVQKRKIEIIEDAQQSAAPLPRAPQTGHSEGAH